MCAGRAFVNFGGLAVHPAPGRPCRPVCPAYGAILGGTEQDKLFMTAEVRLGMEGLHTACGSWT